MVGQKKRCTNKGGRDDTEDLLFLATAKSESIKHCTTITELVVVWSLCSVSIGNFSNRQEASLYTLFIETLLLEVKL